MKDQSTKIDWNILRGNLTLMEVVIAFQMEFMLDHILTSYDGVWLVMRQEAYRNLVKAEEIDGFRPFLLDKADYMDKFNPVPDDIILMHDLKWKYTTDKGLQYISTL